VADDEAGSRYVAGDLEWKERPASAETEGVWTDRQTRESRRWGNF
jgi:hypothetical protein